MKEFENINDILEFAIRGEQEAIDFYNKLASGAKTDDMRVVFESFAREEMGHKSKLLNIKQTGSFVIEQQNITDLKIADFIVHVQASENMTYPEALVLAMKREKSAFKLYSVLAEKANDATIKNLFQLLAMEESKHKLRFELEYDEYVLKEN